ncbi:MAG TPA: hypothetical protein VLI70_03695, partial [Micrococcaceae bacterium]|nr:hypothetical protein [Micrococcaceae bacterium]
MTVLSGGPGVAGEPHPAVLAFDVGGTDTKAGILQGPIGPGEVKIRDLRRVPTPRDASRPGDAVIER